MATNFNTNPFGIYAHPFSGSLKTGSAIDVINFINSSPFFTSSKQADAGSIAVEYTKLSQSGSNAGAAANIVFKVAGKEFANENATEVFKISATGSGNEPRIGIGNFDSSTIDSFLHVKGDTLVDEGEIKVKSGAETVSVTKDNLKDLLQGKAVSDSSEGKNAARGGITQTFAANALFNLNDTATLIKTDTTGIIELKADNTSLIKIDGTAASNVITVGSNPKDKTNITGSLNVSGSSSYVVSDLLTLLGNYGQTGSFSVSGSSTFNGDTNLDGVVNTTDLMNLLAGYNASGSNIITGSLVIDDRGEGGTALSITGSTTITGSTDVTGSFGVLGDVDFDGQVTVNDLMIVLANYSQTGSFNVQGDTNLDGVVNTTDLLNVLAGFNASGSNVITGSLTLEADAPTDTALEITTGIVQTQQINATNIGASGAKVDFPNLPTSDPGISGRLFRTASEAMGMTAGYQVVLFSA